MNRKWLVAVACVALGFALVTHANEEPAAAKADAAKAEKVDFYAVPVPKVTGTVISVKFTLQDKDKKPSAVKLGTPKIVFKQNGTVVHEGNMKPG